MGLIGKWVALPACGAALLASGCGSSEEKKKDAFIPAQPIPGEKPVQPRQSIRIDMKDIAFNPHLVAVNAGGTITWTNKDRVAHNVTKRTGAGPRFESGDVAPKKTYGRRFDTLGQISYLCTIHANMTATVRVVE